jgi:putative resolvase
MYTPSKFALRVGVSVHTLQRWDREGRLIAKRTHTNRRYYSDEDVEQVLGRVMDEKRKTVVYCRVSSNAQKPDLTNQRQMLEQFCAARGIAVDEWIEEVGSGMNFKRKQFVLLIDGIVAGEIGMLVIAHQDRLVRFGFDLLEHLCQQAKCSVLVMNNVSLSPEGEMVEDLMTIVHTFSSRLDGLRSYRKTLEKALTDDKSTQDTPEPHR